MSTKKLGKLSASYPVALTAHTDPVTLIPAYRAAELLGIKAHTLATWRCTRAVEIPYVKLGRRINYRLSDLEAFCARNTVHGQDRGQ